MIIVILPGLVDLGGHRKPICGMFDFSYLSKTLSTVNFINDNHLVSH